MKPLRHFRTLFLLFAIACLSQPLAAFGQTDPAAVETGHERTSTERDGQHDFDFNLGTWKTHILILQDSVAGSTKWVALEGKVVARKVWDGRAQLEEIEADGSTGHFEGLTLFLYNPQSRQWSQNFANSNLGDLAVPTIGEFKNGQGEFFSQEPYRGRTALIRGVWSDITPNSHRFEQSFSCDGGKTWEPNFIATLTRESSAGSRTK